MSEIIAYLTEPISIIFFTCLFAVFLFAFITGWVWKGLRFSEQRNNNARLKDANRKLELLEEEMKAEELDKSMQVKKLKKESAAIAEVIKFSEQELKEMQQEKENHLTEINNKLNKQLKSRSAGTESQPKTVKEQENILRKQISNLEAELALLRLDHVPDDAEVNFLKYGTGSNIFRESLLLARRKTSDQDFLLRAPVDINKTSKDNVVPATGNSGETTENISFEHQSIPDEALTDKA